MTVIWLWLGLLLWAWAAAPEPSRRTHSSALLIAVQDEVSPAVAEQLWRGADGYYRHCSVCHGDLLGGLEEARAAFPQDHQGCERCHRPHNPAQMPLERMNWRFAFSIGGAPALLEVASRFPTALALFSYVQATMPRPFPNSLSEQDYIDISLFLYAISGVLPQHIVEDSIGLEELVP